MRRSLIGIGVVGALLALGSLVLAACTPGEAQTSTALSERTIYVQATELDARRTLGQDAFPQATRDAFPQYFGDPGDPEKNDGAPGYYLFMTSDEEWRIGSYTFLPQEIIAYQGERITMEVLGVRGGHHGNVLVDPDGNTVDLKGADGGGFQKFDVNRGELHVIQFTPEKPGVYQLVCLDHNPTMVMNIHVLPQ